MLTPEERRARSVACTLRWKAKNLDKAKNYWKSPKSQETRKRYYESDAGKEARKKSYEKNKEIIKARNRVRAQTPEYKAAMSAYHERRRKEPAYRIYKTLLGSRTHARSKGWDFDESLFDDLTRNPPTHCACCHRELTYSNVKRGLRNPSIDRVDNSKSYVVGNAHIVCWHCNNLKRHGTLEDFEHIVAYMKERLAPEPGMGGANWAINHQVAANDW